MQQQNFAGKTLPDSGPPRVRFDQLYVQCSCPHPFQGCLRVQCCNTSSSHATTRQRLHRLNLLPALSSSSCIPHLLEDTFCYTCDTCGIAEDRVMIPCRKFHELYCACLEKLRPSTHPQQFLCGPSFHGPKEDQRAAKLHGRRK